MKNTYKIIFLNSQVLKAQQQINKYYSHITCIQTDHKVFIFNASVYLCVFVFMYLFACELEHAQVCVCVCKSTVQNHLEVSHDPTVCRQQMLTDDLAVEKGGRKDRLR